MWVVEGACRPVAVWSMATANSMAIFYGVGQQYAAQQRPSFAAQSGLIDPPWICHFQKSDPRRSGVWFCTL